MNPKDYPQYPNLRSALATPAPVVLTKDERAAIEDALGGYEDELTHVDESLWGDVDRRIKRVSDTLRNLLARSTTPAPVATDSHLLDAIRSCDDVFLRKWATYLKESDGEGWAIGELVERCLLARSESAPPATQQRIDHYFNTVPDDQLLADLKDAGFKVVPITAQDTFTEAQLARVRKPADRIHSVGICEKRSSREGWCRMTERITADSVRDIGTFQTLEGYPTFAIVKKKWSLAVADELETLITERDAFAAKVKELEDALRPFVRLGETQTVRELRDDIVMYKTADYFIVAGDFQKATAIAAKVNPDD